MQPGKCQSIEENGKTVINRLDNGAPGIYCSASSASAAKQCQQTGRDFQRTWLIVRVLHGKITASYLQHSSQIGDAVTAILPMPEEHIHKGTGGIVRDRKVLVRDQNLFFHHCYRQQEMDRNLH